MNLTNSQLKKKFELSRSAKSTETFHEDLAKLKVV